MANICSKCGKKVGVFSCGLYNNGGDALGDDGDGTGATKQLFRDFQRLLQIGCRMHLHGANQRGISLRNQHHVEAAQDAGKDLAFPLVGDGFILGGCGALGEVGSGTFTGLQTLIEAFAAGAVGQVCTHDQHSAFFCGKLLYRSYYLSYI